MSRKAGLFSVDLKLITAARRGGYDGESWKLPVLTKISLSWILWSKPSTGKEEKEI